MENLTPPEEAIPEEKLTIRIKCRISQNITVRDVSSLKKVEEFLQDLSNLTRVPHDAMALLRGFPPKRIAYDRSMTLQALGIINQDTIIVELDKTGSPGAGSELLERTGSSQAPTAATVPVHPKPNVPVVSKPKNDSSNISGIDNQGAEAASSSSSNKKTSHSSTTKPPSGHSGTASNSSINTGAGRSRWDQHLQSLAQLDQVPSPGSPSVPLGSTGVVMRKVIPSDNSCLFSAITFCRTGAENASSADLRELIAKTVMEDPVTYNDGYLGRSNKEYVDWILRFDSWGGGIELAILAAHFALEINVMDTQHLRVNRFGEDQEYDSRIFLIYDGIHYDALYLECYDGSRMVTIFPATDTSVYDQVMDLGREANASHHYTDVKNFKLKCGICHERFTDSEDATLHAKATGHQKFTETT